MKAFNFLLIFFAIFYRNEAKVTYTFPEFQYKETNKNEVMFREVEAACQRGCHGRIGVSKILCIRQCISPSCYKELYHADLIYGTVCGKIRARSSLHGGRALNWVGVFQYFVKDRPGWGSP
uniref:Uncharacterized protein LOC114327167 n=1 Tax=Diabrotica virgifera virgifera TaxID=50390 RepID=A0A6P7F9N0_DIAVI